MTIKGLSHFHTSLTDGDFTVDEISKFINAKGFNFIIMTEHAETISPEEYDSFKKSCEKNSGENLIVIPGLEFSHDNYVHILGIGLKKHPGTCKLESQVSEIHKYGGLAVMAHANACVKIPYDKLKDLDGVEAWNTRYGSKFAPRKKGLDILKKFRDSTGKNIPCFGGIDFHSKKDFRELSIEMRQDGIDADEIIKNLKNGNFKISNKIFTLCGDEIPSTQKLILFKIVNKGYDIIRQIIILTKKMKK